MTRPLMSCIGAFLGVVFTTAPAVGQHTPRPLPLFPELEGFPVLIEGAGKSSVTVGDIEGDGDLEICFGTSYGKVYMLHHTGSMVEGWPISTEDEVFATPSLVDLDDDGDLEVFFTNSTYLYAYHHDATPVEGYPALLTDSTYTVESTSTPAIGDIEGDGDLEIVHGAREHPCFLFAWHHDGTPVEGWPIMLPGGYYNHCDVFYQAPALGDLDGDGTLEIIIATRGAQVFVFTHEGIDFPGWPKEDIEPISLCAPAIGDIDGDGEVEIVVGSAYQKIYAWDQFGNDKPGWPWEATVAGDVDGIVLSDIVGDSALEVIANFGWPDSMNVFVLDGSTATVLPGWPQPDEIEVRGGQPVVISDIDYDGQKEIVMAAFDDCSGPGCLGYILAYNVDGTMLPGFPISLGYEGAAYTPCLVDLDQDDDLEICAVTDYGYIFFGDCYIHAWDLPSTYVKEQGDWPFIYQSPFHTNNPGFLLPTENPIDVDLAPDTMTVRRGESFGLTASFTNRNVVYQSFTTGLFLRLPTGEPYGGNPLYGPYSLRLPLLGGFSIERQMGVPVNAPLGDYRLLLPAGTSVHNIMDVDSTIVHVVE